MKRLVAVVALTVAATFGSAALPPTVQAVPDGPYLCEQKSFRLNTSSGWSRTQSQCFNVQAPDKQHRIVFQLRSFSSGETYWFSGPWKGCDGSISYHDWPHGLYSIVFMRSDVRDDAFRGRLLMNRPLIAGAIFAATVIGAAATVGLVAGQTVDPPSDHVRLCRLEDRARIQNPWCDPTTSSTVAPSTSTTAAPTSTVSPTTQSPTTSTTSPPGGSTQFFEDFTGDTLTDFTATFDWSVADLNLGGRNTNPWQGHHNTACENPTTERQLTHGPAGDNTDPGDEFWLCGPGGDATDHLMTSNGRNNVFGVTAFSPHQSFTGNRVCWDVNLTVSPGVRRWWEVQILPAHYVADAISMLQMGTVAPGEERGTAFLAWGAGVGGTLQNRILPLGGLIWDFTEEINALWRGNEPDPNGAGFDVSQAATRFFRAPFTTRFVTTDRATRSRHCWTDNGNGTMTIRQARPGQPDFVATVAGQFPQPFRVIFADHNYDSGKDGSLDSQTWHWDNLEVSQQ